MSLVRRRYDMVLIALVGGGLFVYSSISPRYELRAELPGELVDAAGGAGRDRAAQLRVAQGYWTSMVANIQWNYRYGHDLPQEPPPEFLVGVKGGNHPAVDPVARTKYWKRVREIWLLPSSWTKNYVWETSWIVESVGSLADWLRERIGNVVKQ